MGDILPESVAPPPPFSTFLLILLSLTTTLQKPASIRGLDSPLDLRSLFSKVARGFLGNGWQVAGSGFHLIPVTKYAVYDVPSLTLRKTRPDCISYTWMERTLPRVAVASRNGAHNVYFSGHVAAIQVIYCPDLLSLQVLNERGLNGPIKVPRLASFVL